MYRITKVLADNNISILGSVTNDSAEYGIVRLIVSEPDAALKALKEADFICRSADVIGVEIADEAGSLSNVLAALEESYINVHYLYLSFNRENGQPIIILHAEDSSEVELCLGARGFKVINS